MYRSSRYFRRSSCHRFLDLYRYRSKKRWQEDLRKYREDRYIPFRAFEFAKGEKHLTVSKTEGYIPHPFQDRQKEWERLWQGAVRVLRSVQYAENGKYQYTRPAKQVDGSGVVTVQLPEKCCPPETNVI